MASLPYRAGPLETTGELLRVPEADQMVVPSIESRNGSRTNLTASRSTSVTVSPFVWPSVATHSTTDYICLVHGGRSFISDDYIPQCLPIGDGILSYLVNYRF